MNQTIRLMPARLALCIAFLASCTATELCLSQQAERTAARSQADSPQAATTVNLWEGAPPGRIAAEGEEKDTSGPDGRKVAGKTVIRLGNVSQPSLTVFSPPESERTGAAVLVCPGGGYHILAYDLEGTEVCAWLNSIGVTGILLKYRVPRPEGDRRPIEPLQDAQRAMSIIRQRASEWGIDRDRIGVLGFSAGGNLAARLSTNFDQRSYEARDEIDSQSCKPNFSVLVYPAYLFDPGEDAMTAADLPITQETPPTFMTMAFDDRVNPENVYRYAIGLKRHDVPTEVHVYPTGGHGFGLRETDEPITRWPELTADWMQRNGWLEQ